MNERFTHLKLCEILLFFSVELISILSSFAGISVLTATLVCLICIGVRVKKHMNARVARAQTHARGSVVLTADPEAPTETPANSQQVNTSSSTQDADSSETENRIKKTMLSSVLELPHHLMSLPVTTKRSR